MTTMTSTPKVGTRWVWEIEQERGRVLLEVLDVHWNGEEWWVRTRTMPEAPTPMLAPLADCRAATPVGGSVGALCERRAI